MKPHKWAKEIKAWADGAEIEWRWGEVIDGKYDNWRPFCKENKLSFFEEGIEYRIKLQPSGCLACVTCGQLVEQPQPKEPQYLYAWATEIGIAITLYKEDLPIQYKYIGKIKLENEE